MPQNDRPIRDIAEEAVASILNGKTTTGADLHLNIPFTRDPWVRSFTAQLLTAIMQGATTLDLDDDQLTALTAKLLSHLSRTGAQTTDAIAAFPAETFADALRQRPDLITSRASVAAILRTHQQANQQAAAQLNRQPLADTPPRSILWQDGRWRIEEATDPRHLQHDSATLRHCVGTLYDREALDALRGQSNRGDALTALFYWQKIHRGESRILTLTHDGTPSLTIEYLTATRAITQIEGTSRTLNINAPNFPPLCRALAALRNTLAFTTIKAFPILDAGYILTTSGKILPGAPDNIQQALAGSIILPPTSSATDVVLATNTPHIIADLAYLPVDILHNIPAEPRAELHLATHGIISLPQLKSGTIRVIAHGLDLPNFEHGTIASLHTPSVHLPRFQTGTLEAGFDNRGPRHIDLPAFRQGNLILHTAEHLSAPFLEHANVIAKGAKVIDLPRYKTGNLTAPSAITIYLPQHHHGDIEANAATKLIAPEHEIGSIAADRATDLLLPRHREGDLLTSAAQNLDLPEFTTGGLLLDQVRTLDLPKHRKGSIIADQATQIRAPMHEHGRISAPKAHTLDLPSHISGAVTASINATINSPSHRPQPRIASRRAGKDGTPER